MNIQRVDYTVHFLINNCVTVDANDPQVTTASQGGVVVSHGL